MQSKRSGTGNLYRPDGSLEYTGEWRNGLRNGEGIEFYEDGVTYHWSGLWKDDQREKRITEYRKDGKKKGFWNKIGRMLRTDESSTEMSIAPGNR